MCTYFEPETNAAQNLIDEFFSNFDCQKTYIFIQCLWLRIIRRFEAAITKKNYLRLLPFYMAVAIYCYYEKVRRTMRIAIVSYLLKSV